MPRKKEDRHDAAHIARRLGQRLRVLRKAAQMTQAKVSDAIGLTTEAFARIERGISLPSYPTLMRICSALGTTPNVLLTDVRDDLPEYALGGEPGQEEVPQAEIAALVYDLRSLDPRVVRDLGRVVKTMRDLLASAGSGARVA